MPSVRLHLKPGQDAKTQELARKLNLTRNAYIRKALDEFNARVEHELLARRFRSASEKCRDQSLQVCREFEALEAWWPAGRSGR